MAVVVFTTRGFVADAPPTVTVIVPENPVPVMVIEVPPNVDPRLGLTLETVGLAAANALWIGESKVANKLKTATTGKRKPRRRFSFRFTSSPFRYGSRDSLGVCEDLGSYHSPLSYAYSPVKQSISDPVGASTRLHPPQIFTNQSLSIRARARLHLFLKKVLNQKNHDVRTMDLDARLK